MKVVTLACGRRGYGEMAMNLAVSLKSFLPEMKLTVISDGQIEKVPGHSQFCDVIKIDSGQNPFELKTRLNQFTSEPSIFIDADSIFLQSPLRLFQSISQLELAIMEYHRHEKSNSKTHWIGMPELWKKYGWGENDIFPEYNSSVIYWKPGEIADRFFKSANYFYFDEAPIAERVGKYYPDEVAFGCASVNEDIYSEIPLWRPAYLQFGPDISESEIKEKYTLLTMSGGNMPPASVRLYNSVAAKSAKKFNIRYYPFGEVVKSKAYLNG